jgi:plasmid maintenance system killer protein
MGRMQCFVADLLAAEGALVEPIEPEGLEVLAPPPLQRALAVPELYRIGFGATLPPGAERVGIESDWLGRFARLLGERGRWMQRTLAPELRPPADPEAMLEHELVLDNATYRLLGVAPAWTRYLVLEFRYSAVSDEKRDGVLALAVNLATGALADAVAEAAGRWLDAGEADPELPPAADLPPAWPRQRVLDLIAQALPPRLDAALAPFVKSLRRRLERDQDRLHAYHNDLHREAMRRAAALPPGDAAHRREQMRIGAIGREYQAKLDDLARHYAMRVAAEWVQTLELAMPVQRFTVQLRRRKAERVLRLDYNPLARRLEAPVCEAGFLAERVRLMCDDALHLVSLAGFAPCSACGKPFCRACSRERCPKCGAPAPPSPLEGNAP